MLLTLIGKKTINKMVLPQEIAGSYWLYNKDYDESRKLVYIESFNNNWQIQSTNYFKIINTKNIRINNDSINILVDGNEILDKVILKDYNFYYVTIGNSNNVYVLYCSPLCENNYLHLHIKSSSVISIGKEQINNTIAYDIPLLCKTHAKILFINGIWSIENCDKRYCIYVNNEPVYDTVKILDNGDLISIFGLNLILIDRDIFINNPLNKVKWNSDYFTLANDGFSEQEMKLKNQRKEQKEENERFFLRSPRMLELIEEKEVPLASPQIPKRNKEIPMALIMGSSFSMGLMSILTATQTILNYSTGNSTLRNTIFSLLMSLAMLIPTILIPLLNHRYSKKINLANEKEMLENYQKYTENKLGTIEELLKNARENLYNTYVSPEECADIILNKPSRLWERQITDNDFLTVRLGIGDITSNIKLIYSKDENINGTKKGYDLMENCIEKARIIKDAPMLLSLTEDKKFAIIYRNEKLKYRYIQNLLIQLVAFQSYDELKIVFLLKDNIENKWDFAKMLPHVWDNSKHTRFFADESNKVDEISQYLENEMNKRIKNENIESKPNIPYYLIIIDDYKNVKDLNFIKKILESDQNYGFSLLFLSDSIEKLPSECQKFLEIEENRGILFKSKNYKETRLDITISTSEIFFFDKICSVLFNTLIKYNEEKGNLLPNNYTFLEMYGVGAIEHLNILNKWRENDTTVSLSAPIGIDELGRVIHLDIHEKFHGPHGLIAGSTGSGKSEFIITYILSLAVNYHPDDVTFVLIDYKGGGLAGAFKRSDVQLPHLVGTITNIETGSLQRSLESIESELKKRQVEFNEARVITGESTIDIYKYQRYYHSGVLKKPISHLFIISDEFAELKQQEPDFMEELISVARIGRSLGVHLILATQKPSGVVNDQIRSNSKFGICLKVQMPSDSSDIIGIPDAAKLSGSGQFYFKVGNDDYLALGQSGWAGAWYNPSDEVKKDIDNSIEFISDTGRILKKFDNTQKKSSKANGEQLTNLVKYISDLAKSKGIHKEQLWLNPIPEDIYLSEIRKKYNVKVEENNIKPIIGEYDDPSRQRQSAIQLNLSSGGNVIIYGNAESGKETLLSTIAYEIITNYSSEYVQLYMLDFGSESLKVFKKSFQVGDIIFSNEGEKIARFFMMLQKELKDRKKILADYNGDYNLYLKTTKNIMPTYVIILNNFESFSEIYPNAYDEILEMLLREGLKYGFTFIITLSLVTGMRYRMLQNFKQKIVLQMNKDDDYPSILEHLGKKRPSHLFGRGLINPELEEKMYYEFQTAKVCKPEEWNEHIIDKIKIENKKSKIHAKPIVIVPEIVTINDLEPERKDLSSFPIGISNKNITPCLINLKNNLLNVMIAQNIVEFTKFISSMIEEIKLMPNINFTILDAENILQNKKENIKDQYIEFFKDMIKSNDLKDTICVIIGLDKFLTELGSQDLFFESLKNAEELKKCFYVIIDSTINLNNYCHFEWYKKYVTNSTGIWLGSGVSEQYILKSSLSSVKLLNNCGICYGYNFMNGKPALIKLLGMKEVDEENE